MRSRWLLLWARCWRLAVTAVVLAPLWCVLAPEPGQRGITVAVLGLLCVAMAWTWCFLAGVAP